MCRLPADWVALSLAHLEENKAALDAYNDYVAKHGLPLTKYRLF